jgi:WXG100 family type VII secretion target
MAFEVTPEYIAAAATDCDATAGQITEQLNAIRSYVYSLREHWVGPAAETFEALMQNFDGFASMLHTALVGIGSGLRGNYTNYVTVEDQARSNLVQVDGEIPGAYL